MVATDDDQREHERKRIRRLQIAYTATWLLVWFVQRVLEFRIIKKEQTNRWENISALNKWGLLVFNGIELVIEVCLYSSLASVFTLFRSFLTSVDEKNQFLTPLEKQQIV